MPGFSSIGELPIMCVPPDIDQANANVALQVLRPLSDKDLRYLMEIYSFNPAIVSEKKAIPQPIGSVPVNGISFKNYGMTIPILLSDAPFITGHDQTIPNIRFNPAILPGAIAEISIAGGDIIGTFAVGTGSAEIANGDGSANSLLELITYNRPVIVRALAPGMDYDNAIPAFVAVVRGIERDDNRITLQVADFAVFFDSPILGESYRGTGGLEGGADILGRLKPFLYGECYNVEPVLVSAADMIFQLHNGSMEAVVNVYDRGVPLNFDADYSDINLASPGAGEYATCLATGHIKLGSTSDGRITVDAKGDNSDGYISTPCALFQRIVKKHVYFAMPVAIDANSVTALDAEFPADCGIYITERLRGFDIVDRLLGGMGYFWYTDPKGEIALASAWGDTMGTEIIDESIIIEDGIDQIGLVPAAWRITVGYAPAFQPQDASELAGAISAAQREFVTNAYRTVVYENSGVRALNKNVKELEFYTTITDKAMAGNLLERLVLLYSTEKKIYRIPQTRMLRFQIGTRAILKYPRLGPDREVLIQGLSADFSEHQTILTVRG